MAAAPDDAVPSPATKKIKVRGGDSPKVFQLPGEDCPICLSAAINCKDEEFAGAVRTPCGHLFHRKCIQEYLHVGAKCPICTVPLVAGDLQPLETAADGQLIVPFPARHGVLAALMRVAMIKGWNSKKPSPTCIVAGKRYRVWQSYREELSTGALIVQSEDNFKSSNPEARQCNKLGITLNVEGKIAQPDAVGSHTIAGLMVDTHLQTGLAFDIPLSSNGRALDKSFESVCLNWIQMLTQWEPVIAGLFKEIAAMDGGENDAALTAKAHPAIAFVPYEREIAGAAGLSVTYLGHEVAIAEGCGYYRDPRGQIIVGYHGTTDPPVDMAGESLLELLRKNLPAAEGLPLPGYSVNTVVEYLKLRLFLERVNAGHKSAYEQADGVEPIMWNSQAPTVGNPHLFTVGGRGHQYVVWVANTEQGLGLTIQAGPDYHRKKRDSGKLGFMLDHRNMQIWYILVNGKAVPDFAMPQNGALMRGEWHVPGWGPDVKFMGSVMGRLLKNIVCE